MDYQIQPGDTLAKIAKRYGVSVKSLQEANGIKNANLIFAGKTLKIPVESEEAFNIKGFTLESADPEARTKRMKDFPTEIRAVYAVIFGPDDKSKGIGGDIKLLYGVPTPSNGPAPTLPTQILPTDTPVQTVYGVPTPTNRPTPTTPTEIKPTTPSKPENDENVEVLPDKVIDEDVICHDRSGKTKDIRGTLKIIPNEDGSDKNPTKLTITDSSSGKARVYLFERVSVDEQGNAIYKCVSRDDRPCITENQYRLEYDENGKPTLQQYEDQANHGKGLKFGAPTKPTAPAPTPTTPSGATPTTPTGATPTTPTGATSATPSVVPVYAVPIEPSGAEPRPTLPTGVTPTTPSGATPTTPTGDRPFPTFPTPSVVPVYAVPVDPSGVEPRPTLPTGITPTTPTMPTGGRPFPTLPSPSVVPMYAVPVDPSGVEPRPTLPTGITPTTPTGVPRIRPTNPVKPAPVDPTKPVKPDPVQPTKPVQPKPVQPTKPEPLTDAEAKRARSYGAEVSDYLVGYTTDSEEGLIKNIVTNSKKLNSRNVIEFLKGYENSRGMGDHFFEQCVTEMGFGNDDWNEQDLMTNVAKKFLKHIEGMSAADAKEIRIILQDGHFTKAEARKMDNIVRKYL